MPILTNLNPVTAYTASVTTDGTILTNGLGVQLTSLQLTASYAQSASFAVTSSISVISQFDISSSFASSSVSSSVSIVSISSSFASQSISASNSYWANSARVDDINNGLIVYLPFSEGSGSQLRNLSPYGVDATKWEVANGAISVVTASGWTTNSKRGGYSQLLTPNTNFSGSASYIEFNNATIAAGLPSMSFAIWYQSSGSTVGVNGGRIVTKFNSATSGEFSYTINNNTLLSVILVNSLNQRLDQVATVPALNDNKWHHVAATYDGLISSVYIDGLLCSTASFTGSLQNSIFPLRVGTFQNIGLSPLCGYVDEFKLWGRALLPNEIKYLYNDGNLENGIYTNPSGNNTISGSTTFLNPITIADQITMRESDGQGADVYAFVTQSALFITTSGSSVTVGMGNGICFADNGFQVGGGVGFEDIRQQPGVAVWETATLSLSSSNVTLTEVNTLHNISSSTLLQTQIDGKQAFLPTASVSPSNPSTIVGWVNITVQGTLFWMPLYK